MEIEEVINEPVQSELPTGWINIQVKDAVLNIATTDKKIPQKSYLDAGLYPVIDQGRSHIGGYTNDESLLVDAEPPTIVFGDHTKMVKYISKKFAPGADGIKVLKPHSFVDAKFAYYAISHVAINIKSMGYARHYQHLAKSNIGIPPLAEQQHIVAKLEELFSELDKGVENLRTAQQQLKVYRQTLLKHAFEGKLTADWRAQNPDKLESADVLLARAQQERKARYQQQLQDWEDDGKTGSKPKAPKALPPLTAEELIELSKLPNGWAWLKVHQLCDVVRGGSPRPAGDPKFYGGSIPFLKVADITSKNSPYLKSFTYTITEAGLSKTRKVEPKTLLLSNSGATLGVPKICLIPATMNDGVAAFLGLPHDDLLYHYYFWQSKTESLRNIDQGAAQPNLNTDIIKETAIPICSQEEQLIVTQKIESVLSDIDQLEQTITHSLQQAEALRQSILKKAFSGQLVAQDPNDEPASVLLERIRAERAAQPKARGRKAKVLA